MRGFRVNSDRQKGITMMARLARAAGMFAGYFVQGASWALGLFVTYEIWGRPMIIILNGDL